MKLRKILSSIVAGAVAVSAMTFAASAAVISDKETVLDASWSAWVDMDGASFTEPATLTVSLKDVKADAKLCVKSKADGWPQLVIGDVYKTDASESSIVEQGVVVLSEDATYVSVDLTEDMVKELSEKSGLVAGQNLTITGITLGEAAPAEEETTEETATEETAAADLGGTVNAALYVGENVTWVTAASDAQAISTTGEYTFKIEDLAIAPTALTVIYVKDADVEAKTTTETAINADTQVLTKSIKINGEEVALTDGYLTGLKNGVLDLCWYNIWETNFVSVDGIEEINSVEVTVEFAEAAAEEEEAEAEEEATEEVEEEATEEEAEEEESEEEAAEVDWDSYDEDAMVAANEAFTLGGAIDIYAVVGDAWADIALIEADFIWTPGLGGWCGGAGIGNGAVAADGSTWISGPEYGAANANSKYEPDGKATQTLVDLSANPLTAIASVNEDGTTSFAHIQVQDWWNGAAANAQVAAIRFLDADGEVIGELEYEVEAPAAEEETTEAPAAGDVSGETDSSKGSPDTGIEDVAVVAGLAIVAGGAVLVSKKRK